MDSGPKANHSTPPLWQPWARSVLLQFRTDLGSRFDKTVMIMALSFEDFRRQRRYFPRADLLPECLWGAAATLCVYSPPTLRV